MDAERHLKTTSLLHIRECARMKADFWTPALFVTIAVHYRYQANYLLHNILFSNFFFFLLDLLSLSFHMFSTTINLSFLNLFCAQICLTGQINSFQTGEWALMSTL